MGVATMLRNVIKRVHKLLPVDFKWLLGILWIANVVMFIYMYNVGSWGTSLISRLLPASRFNLGNEASIPDIWQERDLIPVPGLKNSVQLFNVVAGNSSNTSSWDRIFVHGWIYGKAKSSIRYCCVMNSAGSVRSYPIVETHSHFGTGKRFSCNVKEGEDVMKATLSDRRRCNRNVTHYMDVEYPHKHSEEVAIFAKVIYGNISAINLIVWFEIHKLFGVNKVAMYTYDLCTSARKVLHFYSQQGLLELIPYTIPGNGKMYFSLAGSRGYPDAKTRSAWTAKESAIFDGFARLKGYKYVLGFDPDEFAIPTSGKTYLEFLAGSRGYPDAKTRSAHTAKESAIFDGFARLKGYKYVIGFDPDEFAIPTSGKTYLEFLDEMFAKHPDVAGFYFKTYVYVKDWGISDDSSPFDVGRFRLRTKAMNDRIKHATIPSRLSNKGFFTHRLFPAPGYRRVYFKENEAVIHHFRKCRKQWLKSETNGSCFNMKQYYDDTVFRLLQKVQDKVLKIAAELNI